MRYKNLIISTVGDDSCHKEWIKGERNFDLILIYYGDNYVDYDNDALLFIKQKGQKYPLIKNFIDVWGGGLLDQYDFIWLPDDDISISTEDINRLFDIAREYDLDICQPTLTSTDGYVAHLVTIPIPDTKLRYTNFVEIMAPLFKYSILKWLYSEFSLSESGWGLDISWQNQLIYPEKKMAIIDDVIMAHTRPVSTNYSRFKTPPRDTLNMFLNKYDTKLNYQVYSTVLKNQK